jgi:acyl-CoA thioester hydrolase
MERELIIMDTAETAVQVRYAETDQMGVVYHANYLVWFELGRSALLDSLGLDYVQLEKEGLVSPVIKVEASFISPARYGEEVTIKTWVQSYDGLRVTYFYEVLVADRLCVTGSTVNICVRTEDFKPVSIRRRLPHWDQVYQRIKRDQS